MTVQPININDLRDYVEAALDGDEDILRFYDKKEKVETISEACSSVVNKIRIAYTESDIRGVKINGSKVGYFVFDDELLISFGLNINYRNKVILTDFWEKIKEELGDTFNCLLYSHNERAIGFLKKCGMNIIFDTVTVLRFENNLN